MLVNQQSYFFSLTLFLYPSVFSSLFFIYPSSFISSLHTLSSPPSVPYFSLHTYSFYFSHYLPLFIYCPSSPPHQYILPPLHPLSLYFHSSWFLPLSSLEEIYVCLGQQYCMLQFLMWRERELEERGVLGEPTPRGRGVAPHGLGDM